MKVFFYCKELSDKTLAKVSSFGERFFFFHYHNAAKTFDAIHGSRT
jgi:hypothetical protein